MLYLLPAGNQQVAWNVTISIWVEKSYGWHDQGKNRSCADGVYNCWVVLCFDLTAPLRQEADPLGFTSMG